MIRLNKYMSEAGVCSRREADRLIEAGKVTVDGMKATVGMQIEEGQKVCLNGKPIEKDKKDKLILLAVNKPRGVVCSEKSQGGDVNIIDFLHYPKRITYVGRLDKDSEGLLLMTNHGDIINKMMRAANGHEKEYEVTVDKEFNDRFLKDMAAGVHLKELDVTTKPCQVERLGKKKFKIILTQGLNRQIRRMCKELGFHVTGIKRVRIMNIHLGHLTTGGYRNVTEAEIQELMYLLEDSSNEPGYLQELNEEDMQDDE